MRPRRAACAWLPPLRVFRYRRQVPARDCFRAVKRRLRAVRALVTGGTGRLGSAIAGRLEAAGHAVLAAGSAEADLARRTDARALVERAVAELGGLDLPVQAGGDGF